MSNYIIENILWQSGFLFFYLIFIKKETFFRVNRFFLLLTLALSYILPWINLPIRIDTKTSFYQKLEPVILETQNLQKQWELKTFYGFTLFWILGSMVVIGFTLYNLQKIYRLYKQNRREKAGNIILIRVPGIKNAFTFLKYIFIEKNLKPDVQAKIITHEKVHVEEFHTWDLILIQILKIAFWFNPLIYVFEKQIKEVHEYIADQKVIKKFNKKEYLNLLLQNRFHNYELSFVQTFFQKSILKKRIKMQNKKQSPKIHYVKYVGIMAVIFGLSFLINACEKQTENIENNEIDKLKIILIKHVDNTHNKDKEIVVAYQFIKNPPQIEGCEGLEGEAAKNCFSKKIAEHITRNFNTSLAENLDLKNQKVRILTQFTIGKDGMIHNIKARARYKILEEEAKRCISTLPPMKPGYQKEQAVNVTYTLPIIFKIDK